MKSILSWFTIIAIIIIGVLLFWTDRTHAPAISGTETDKTPITISDEVVKDVDQTLQVTTPEK